MAKDDQSDGNPFGRLSMSKSTEQNGNLNPVQALEMAKLLLGCFHLREVDNPLIFVTAVAKVLSMYQIEVVSHVCDPFAGLPGELKWLPAVSEVKAACNARAHEIARIERFLHWGKQLPAPEHERNEPPKPTREELEKKYGKNFGLIGDPVGEKSKFHPMTRDELEKHYEMFVLGHKKREER
jgi:hypothetical protein